MTRDYSGYVDPDYLDAAARLLLPSKLRTYELMELQEGHRVLDLGCGPASDDEVRRFRADLEQSAEIGGFLVSANQLLVTGRKPLPAAGS